MAQLGSKHPISRRKLLSIALRWGGLSVVAPILEACGRAEQSLATSVSSATPSPAVLPTRTVTALPRATPTSLPGVTPTARATAPPTAPATATVAPSPSPIAEAAGASLAFVKTRDRAAGVRRALQLLGLNPVQGKQVLLKPNFNSADPAPASTHPDTLRALVEELWGWGASRITVADRSGMGVTSVVMRQLGVLDLGVELGFDAIALDELSDEQNWVMVRPPDSHWKNGFPFARVCYEAEALVQTCCLKPHRFGGHFTLSLKNTVGMVGAVVPGSDYNFMDELHSSPRYQRFMIAEANTAYTPALVVLDGVEAFISQGPDRGARVWGEVVMAGSDRVAMDAVGVALLRHLGVEGVVNEGPIFEQEQIARAVELGLGVDAPQKIRLVTDDPDSETYATQIREILAQG